VGNALSRQQAIQMVRGKTAEYAKRFVIAARRDSLRHQTMLAITLIGLFAAYSQVGVAAGLGALVFELGRGVSDLLKRPRSVIDQDDHALLVEAMTLIEQMSEEQKASLHIVSDEIGVWQQVLQEVLQQHRLDLVGDFENILAEWGEKLALSSLHAMLDGIQQQAVLLQQRQGGQGEQLSEIGDNVEVLLGLVQTIEQQMARQNDQITALRDDIQQQSDDLTVIRLELATVRGDLKEVKTQFNKRSSRRPHKLRRDEERGLFSGGLAEKLWDDLYNDFDEMLSGEW
jgi:regulator of replication initiation timing